MEYKGYAATDKANNSRKLKVYVPELLPYVSGNIKGTDIKCAVSTVNDKQEATNFETTTSNYIECDYQDDSDNGNIYPPDVRVGELVTVYTVGGDENHYYWKAAARTAGSRRTETKRIGISATLENNTDLNNSNSYYLEFDSRRDNRGITISTSQANSEPFGYKIRIDTTNGSVTIADNIGNCFVINSRVPSVSLQTSEGSGISINAKDINSECKGDMTTHVYGNMRLIIDGNLDITTKGNVTLDTKGNVSIGTKGTNDFDSKGVTNVTSGAKVAIKAPSVDISG